jgi:hypothetical protein
MIICNEHQWMDSNATECPFCKSNPQIPHPMSDKQTGALGNVWSPSGSDPTNMSDTKTPLTDAAVEAAAPYYQVLYPDAIGRNKPVHADHANKLEAENTRLREQVEKLQRVIDVVQDMGVYPAAILNGPNAYEKRTDKMEGWNDAVMAMHKAIANTEPETETSGDKLSSYIEEHLGHLNKHAHSIYEVIDAAAAIAQQKEGK